MLTSLPLIVSDLPVLVEKVDRGGGPCFRSVQELSQVMLNLAAIRRCEKRWARSAPDCTLALRLEHRRVRRRVLVPGQLRVDAAEAAARHE